MKIYEIRQWLVVLTLPLYEKFVRNKHVESIRFPRLDQSSTLCISTKKKRTKRAHKKADVIKLASAFLFAF